VWKSDKTFEDRTLLVNSMTVVREVAFWGFRYRNGGADPVGMEVVSVV
jgi:hypothetical protein